MFTEEPVKQYENIGFRPLGLYANHIPAIKWGAENGVYNDPTFRWSTSDKVTVDRKLGTPNIATMLGRTSLKDSETGEYLNLNVLDTDSVTVSNRLRVPIRTILGNSSYDWVTDRLRDLLQTFLNEEGVANDNLEETLLDILKKSGYVTKTRKEYGYHFYWLDLKQNPPIGTADCLSGKEFELKTNDKYGLCTLPDSTHRDDPNFKYKAVGRTDVNLVSNVLYDLFVEMFKDCLVNGKLDDNDSVNATDTSTDTNTSNKNHNGNSNTKNRTVNIKNPIVLSDSAIMITSGQMSQFVARKYRNDFYVRFSGVMFHARISEESGAKIIAKMCAITNDEESKSRQDVFTTTYEKGFQGQEIEGAPKLAELIAAKVENQDVISATAMLDNLKVIWRNDKKVKRQREESKLVNVSVAEAQRMQSGYVQVRGSIVGMTTTYDMVKSTEVSCNDCGLTDEKKYETPRFRPHVKEYSKCPRYDKEHKGLDTLVVECEYVPTVDIWLQDMDRSDDLSRLQVKLFDNDTYDINTGEIVDVIGHIYVIRNNDRPMNRLEPVLFAEEVIYTKRKEIMLSDEDKLEIEQLNSNLKKEGKSIVKEAVKWFAPHILGYDHIKEAILIQCANAGIKNNKERFPIRMRVNILLIGDPSTAKSEITSEALEIIPNCQSVNGIASSGISLIAVIEKDSNGSKTINLGTLALAKHGIGRINEIGRLKLDQQPHLFDAMEEGVTDMVKYGFPANIECHVSVLATANPLNNKWNNADKITMNEFPILLQVAQRFDLIFVTRENKAEDFVDAYIDTRKQVAKNYKEGVYKGNLEKLQKYVAYARTFNPVVPDDVHSLLKYFLKQMGKSDVDGLFKKYDSLLRLSTGIARLKLKSVVDAEDANEAMHKFQLMLGEFAKHVGIPRDPRDVAYQEIRQVVKETYNIVPGGIAFKEAVDKACERNSQVNDYLPRGIGYNKDYRSLEDNIKLRPILELLRKDPNIVFVGERPIVMQWNPHGNDKNVMLSDVSDASDVSDVDSSKPFQENDGSKQPSKSLATLTPYKDTNASDCHDFQDVKKNIGNVFDRTFENGIQKVTSETSESSDRDRDRPLGIYKASWTGDVWACRYCGLKGNRSSMWKHDCPDNNIKP